MNSSSRLCILLVAVVLPICSCSSPVKVQTQPTADDYSRLPRTGTASINGEVTARTKGGESKSVAGLLVHIDPATPYSIEVFKALGAHGVFDAEKESGTFEFDPIMVRARRSVRIDNNNRFKIPQIPAGDYFVSCYVRWMVSNGDYSGRWHVRRVRIRDGQSIADFVL